MRWSRFWVRRRCGTRARCDDESSNISGACRAGWSLRSAIRHALLREQPEVVAVELPMSLEERVHAGARAAAGDQRDSLRGRDAKISSFTFRWSPPIPLPKRFEPRARWAPRSFSSSRICLRSRT